MDNEIIQLKNQVESLTQQVKLLTDLQYKNNFSDLIIFDKRVRFNRNITIGQDGLRIGMSPTEKVSLFGENPVIQQAAISPPSGGATIDSQARTAISSLITLMSTFGFTS